MAELADLCNLALGRVGEFRTVADVETDPSPGASAFRRVYEVCRDATLAAADWPFARRVVVASPPVALGSYPYLFPRPADCIAIRGVFLDQACATEPLLHEEVNLPDPLLGEDTVYISTVSVAAATAPDTYLRYTRRVEDVPLFRPSFVEALGWRLGIELAMQLGRSREIRNDCEQMFEKRVSEARAIAMQEARRRQPESELILARWGGRPWATGYGACAVRGDPWDAWIGYRNGNTVPAV